MLAPPSKYTQKLTISLIHCYNIGPNLHHLCLNYCSSLTGDLTVSTFAIYNLLSIQEPDKRLNENQAQSHQWLPISLGVKVQFLQSGSQKLSDSFPTTPPTACSLCPSHRRPLCPLHKSEILLQDLLKGRSLH